MSVEKSPEERTRLPAELKADMLTKLGEVVEKPLFGSGFAAFRTGLFMLYVERPGRISGKRQKAAIKGENPYILTLVERLPQPKAQGDPAEPNRARRHNYARIAMNGSNQRTDLVVGYLELVVGDLGPRVRQKQLRYHRGRLNDVPPRIYEAVREISPLNSVSEFGAGEFTRRSWLEFNDYRTREEALYDNAVGSQLLGAAWKLTSSSNIPTTKLMNGQTNVTCFSTPFERGFVRYYRGDLSAERARIHVEDRTSGIAAYYDIEKQHGVRGMRVRQHFMPAMADTEFDDWPIASEMSMRRRDQELHLASIFDGSDLASRQAVDLTIESLATTPADMFYAP